MGFYDEHGRFIDWRDYHLAPNGWHPSQHHPSALAEPRVSSPTGGQA
jgi:hypothetical protein